MRENFSSTVNIIHMHYVATAMQEFIALNAILHEQHNEIGSFSQVLVIK